MFAQRLKFILLPQVRATLNNYACLLPPLANVNWSVIPQCFLSTTYCKLITGEMVPMEESKMAGRTDIVITVSIHLSNPCSGILALCDNMWTSLLP